MYKSVWLPVTKFRKQIAQDSYIRSHMLLIKKLVFEGLGSYLGCPNLSIFKQWFSNFLSIKFSFKWNITVNRLILKQMKHSFPSWSLGQELNPHSWFFLLEAAHEHFWGTTSLLRNGWEAIHWKEWLSGAHRVHVNLTPTGLLKSP